VAITLLYATFGTVWIVLSGTFLYFAVGDAVLQSRLEVVKGLAFIAVSSGLLFFLLRRREALAASAATAGIILAPDRVERRRTVGMLALLALLVPMIGFSVFALQARHEERAALADLRVIADLKAAQIENWLAERRGDASTLAASGGFIERLAAYRATGDPRLRERLRDQISTLHEAFSYASIRLLDPEGRLLLSVGAPEPPDEAQGREWVRAAAGERLVMRGPRAGSSLLEFLVPLARPGAEAPIGLAVLRSDLSQFLYPLLQAWPGTSSSGAMDLVHPENGSLRYLGKAPPSRDDEEPLRAVMKGAGAATASAMRLGGKPVLAAWRPVAGTDWTLLARIDRSEAMAPARMTAGWATLITLAAAALVALALALLMRHQRLTQQLALRVQADNLTRRFYDLPFVGMAVTEPITHRWVQFNDHLCTLSGYSRDELQALAWPALIHPDDFPRITREIERMMAGESDGYAGEAQFRHKDGGTRHTEIDVKCLRGDGGGIEYFVAIVQDITGRRRSEARILQLNRLYLTLSRCNAAVVQSRDEHALFTEICRAAVETGGMRLAAVSLLEPSGRHLRPVAAAGPGAGDFRALHFSTDAAEPSGRGPTGTVVRTGEPVWVQDFLADERTRHWRAIGERHGWRASAALPVRRGGLPVGALTLCMGEPEAFDEETRRLLAEVAEDLSYALDNLDREAAHRKAVQALAESEERYRLLVDNSQDAIFLTAGRGGRILSANPAACSMFGASVEELVAGGRAALLDPTDPRLRAAVEEHARTGQFAGEVTLRRRSGESFPAEVKAAVFTASDGTEYGSTIIHDITERKRLEHLAEHDALTGLPNRLLFSDRLELALAGTARTGRHLAVMFMDLDRFKNINDSLGHEMGDQLLREAALRLRSSVRATDTVSRQGGDEFLVLLPELDAEEDAARVAEKLNAAMARPFQLGASEVVVSASIGIACSPEDGTEPDVLLRNADAALYAAKGAGRNRYQFYSADMNARTLDRLHLEADLRRALERGQLFLVYQPQVNLASGALVGIEALVRWRHPQRGVVPPAEFIHVAEDSGQITAIGTWVMETACRQHAEWVAQGLAVGSMAVNVSAYQFRQPGFVESVAAALERAGLPPGRLELEVTESVVMQGVMEVLVKLEALQRLGVRLAIDDFGTGYSSLSYLRQFPVHRLKIDQSFTQRLPDDRGSEAIAQAIISMGHSLGMDALAEGVETAAQAERLQSLWCDTAQGYHYAKPLPAEAFADYLRSLGTGGSRAQNTGGQ